MSVLSPLLDGAPALLQPLSGINKLANTAILLKSDADIVRGLFNRPQWGIYLNGQPIAEADSVVSFDYKQEAHVSNYPQEAGAFQSYNKVGSPYDARVQMTKGGQDSDRALFLLSIDSAAATLNLYDVVTPERIYRSANIQRYDYRRTATAGAGLITVELWLIEVRVTAKSAFTQTAAPSGADPVSIGTVQAQTPTAAVTNFVGKVPAPPVTNFVGLVPNVPVTNFVGLIH